ncbi:hypothetical protein SPRG_14475 [Saprolegnia parasitica CBS 223.65]|uniref:Fe2OG dioxygenase domain-containing protein n=1 Tax=Saprolegnia parasitica (strain CBS 223.65) TaxID=695850 RepID=A0A067BP41_SAPPC|nr:hypothetical protein SPRG_14475 [Saprolegnia parasitica CBS 223.65]KDO20229.1 hypothetical protein SPRG_14475 [Saprolegnia parasitica CBS 223.65]|eukprot:XP_012209042.1 hypothetical protein SPRG_14475 [Saprolegnia parasitica CBS 223.65]
MADDVDRFRPLEKQYRHRGNDHKNARQRRHDAHRQTDRVEFSGVIDVHAKEANAAANMARLHGRALSSEELAFNYTILSPRDAYIYEVDGLRGLMVLTGAMPITTQVEWAFRAVRAYSQQPYNNVTNLTGDRGATTRLWQDAWHEDATTSGRPAWKAFQALRWANIGAHYDWTARQYVADPDIPPLPEELQQLVKEVYAMTSYVDGRDVESGIVNFYPAGTSMGGHLDNAESDMINPIVSLSLGTQCIYLQGGLTRATPPTALWLRSGDIILMGGEARRCFHGVPLVTDKLPADFAACTQALKHTHIPAEVDAFADYIAHARVNINLRRVAAR